MSGPEPPIRTQGKIMEVLSARVCMVELRNGKRSYGHLARDLVESGFSLSPGDRVTLQMTPFDFSKARITGRVEPIL